MTYDRHYPLRPDRREPPRRTVAALLFLAAVIPGAGTARADGFSDAFTGGTPSIELRPRWEFVDQNGKADADAFTLRTLLGFTTKSVDGFAAALQFINVADLDGSYNSLVNGKTHFATIGDPSATNVNQAYLSYAGVPDTQVTAGRQIINLDDTRFVGNVDFRQNMQTFDAVSVTSKALPKLELMGSYVWGIKDIVNRHVSASIYLAEAKWLPVQALQIDGFGYWYGNEATTVVAGAAACNLAGVRACNSVTYGFRAHGAVSLPEEFRLEYKGTYAKQSSYDGGSALIDADYVQASAQIDWRGLDAGAEYMLMGSNGNGSYGFQTPLATKHAFNGWAEMFLTTPSKGLDTVDAFVGAKLDAASFVAKYYRFRSDYQDLSYGDEWDLSFVYKFSGHLQAGFEYADYHASGFGASTQAGWLFAKLTY